MKLTVIGCSPAWPNPGGAQSGYLVEGPGRLLLDCGPGVLSRLREASTEDWPEIDAVVVTHWHLDHWGDLVPWVWATMAGFAKGTHKPLLWLPPGGRDALRDFGAKLGWEDMWEIAFELRDYTEGVEFEPALGLRVTALEVPHYTLRTYGLRIANSDHTLAYSGDSGPSDRLAELARDVDLFLCEATLARGDLDGTPRGHLSANEAVAQFAASGAKRLLLTHRPRELALPDGLEQAHDGLQLEL